MGTSSGSGTSGTAVSWPEAPASSAKSSGYFSMADGTPDESVATAGSSIFITREAVRNLEVLLEAEADMKRASEEKSAGLIQELEKMRAQLSELQVKNERLSHQVDTLQQQVSGG
nr:hypothetical protein [Tanacetum cinerariifolium]